MKKLIHFSALWGIALVLAACNLNTPVTPNPIVGETSGLSLVVQVQNPTDNFNTVGAIINYRYNIANTGTQVIAGPVTVSDNIVATVACPDLTTVGNLDASLDPTETITCNGAHTVTQADLDTGSVTNVATASAAGGSVLSAPNGITVVIQASAPATPLVLTKTANPLTYSAAGQTITYTFSISNAGSAAIGPAQFIVVDNRVSSPGVPFPCGPDGTTLNPGNAISCTVTYTITQQDMSVSSLTNSATASGGGMQPSAPAGVTITNSNFQSNITSTATLTATPLPGPSNLTPGTTIQHQVVKGDWMIQIARCYGVTYTSLRNANPQIPNPSIIYPGTVVTVPNIGSAGAIFGPPCVVFHTVAAGDTWNSIATQYKARVDVLQEANRSGLVTGAQIKVPINSAAAGVVQIPVTAGGVTSTPVTATPAVATNTPAPGAATRITFAAGSTTASVSGTLVSHATLSYVVAASQGQTMTISLEARANEIGMRIADPNGVLIKQLDTNATWTGTLPANGDYRIDLVGLTDPDKTYILTVSVVTPTASLGRVVASSNGIGN